MNTIKCPRCGRKHSILKKDGDLRKEIHCRCKVNGSHTLMFWVAGMGYYYYDDDSRLIPVD